MPSEPPPMAGLLPADPWHVTLTVTQGPHCGQVFRFDKHATFLVGRAPEADFALPDDPYFSRNHFLVEINPPLCRLLDLGSRNGTLVNDKKVAAADLADGDLIGAGETVLRVAIPQAAAAQQRAETRSFQEWEAPNAWTVGTTTAAVAGPAGEPSTFSPELPGLRLEKELGRGGMGVVWLARRDSDGSAVAVKTIRPAIPAEPILVQRFLREAAILRELHHPRIVAFHEQGESAGTLFIVMDYVPGKDAGTVLKEQGPLPLGRAVRLLCQLLEGLAYAHARGFVHRDVKPANLLVMGEPGREEARLADFGLARTYQESPLSGLTLTGRTAGTPGYMAPEQVRNFRQVRPAADQYAAAATLYTLLTGQTVHGKAPQREMLQRILTQDPVLDWSGWPDVPTAVQGTVLRGLRRQPEERFADALALRQVLLPFAEG